MTRIKQLEKACAAEQIAWDAYFASNAAKGLWNEYAIWRNAAARVRRLESALDAAEHRA